MMSSLEYFATSVCSMAESSTGSKILSAWDFQLPINKEMTNVS